MKLKSYRWEVVFWVFIVTMLSYFDRFNFSVAAPLIIKELSIDVALMGIIMSGFNIGYTVMNFSGGYLAQKYSARKFLAVIIILWSIMTFFTGFGWSFISLLVIRILFGMCEGPMFLINTKLFNHWMLPNERAFSLGIMSSAMNVGAIFGIPLASFIVATHGWRSVFFIFGALGLVVMFLVLLRLRDTPAEHPSISKVEREKIESSIAQTDGVAALTAPGTSFGELVKNPMVWMLCFVYFSVLMFVWANINWIPTYFLKARGLSLVKSGFLSSLPFVGAALGAIVLGWLSDRGLPFKHRASWVCFDLFCSVPLIIYAVITPSVTVSLACFFMASFFAYGSMNIMFSLVMGVFDRADVPKVTGFMLGSGSFSGIVAPMAVGFVLKATNSFNNAYFAFAALSFIGGFFALLLLKKEKTIKILRASQAVKQSPQHAGVGQEVAVSQG